MATSCTNSCSQPVTCGQSVFGGILDTLSTKRASCTAERSCFVKSIVNFGASLVAIPLAVLTLAEGVVRFALSIFVWVIAKICKPCTEKVQTFFDNYFAKAVCVTGRALCTAMKTIFFTYVCGKAKETPVALTDEQKAAVVEAKTYNADGAALYPTVLLSRLTEEGMTAERVDAVASAIAGDAEVADGVKATAKAVCAEVKKALRALAKVDNEEARKAILGHIHVAAQVAGGVDKAVLDAAIGHGPQGAASLKAPILEALQRGDYALAIQTAIANWNRAASDLPAKVQTTLNAGTLTAEVKKLGTAFAGIKAEGPVAIQVAADLLGSVQSLRLAPAAKLTTDEAKPPVTPVKA